MITAIRPVGKRREAGQREDRRATQGGVLVEITRIDELTRRGGRGKGPGEAHAAGEGSSADRDHPKGATRAPGLQR